MKRNKTKIIIVDNEEKLHFPYTYFLKGSTQYELLGILESMHVLLYNFKQYDPDIIITEASLHGISGINGIEFIRKQKASVKILVMSNQTKFEMVREAFKKGADGFLTKPMSKERLLNALHALEEHGVIMEYDIVKKIIYSFQRKRFESFSKKENQIIELLSQGFTYKMIADRLCVTTSAVNFHIQNIYVKLNVNSKSEALKKLKELEVKRLNAA